METKMLKKWEGFQRSYIETKQRKITRKWEIITLKNSLSCWLVVLFISDMSELAVW